jgi:hypothetical protein
MRPEPSGLCCRARAARERDREAALGVGERDVDGVLSPFVLEETALGLLQPVLAELEVDGSDDGDGNRSDAG